MITSFISTANVQKVSANVSKSISSENVEPIKDVVFDDRPPNVKPNPIRIRIRKLYLNSVFE
jgi:hypothetical protein